MRGRRMLLFAALAVVTACIALLAWLSVPRGGTADAKGRTIARLEVLSSALAEFKKRNLRYPLESEGVIVLAGDGSGILEANPPARAYVLDGWDRPFVYRVTTEGLPVLYSIGLNGIDERGEGDDMGAAAPE